MFQLDNTLNRMFSFLSMMKLIHYLDTAVSVSCMLGHWHDLTGTLDSNRDIDIISNTCLSFRNKSKCVVKNPKFKSPTDSYSIIYSTPIKRLFGFPFDELTLL